MGALTQALEESKANTTEAENANRATAAKLAEAQATATETASTLRLLEAKVRSPYTSWTPTKSQGHAGHLALLAPLHADSCCQYQTDSEHWPWVDLRRSASSRHLSPTRSRITMPHQSKLRPSSKTLPRSGLCESFHDIATTI